MIPCHGVSQKTNKQENPKHDKSRGSLVINQRQPLAHVPPASPLSALAAPIIAAAFIVMRVMVVMTLLARLERLLEHTGVEEAV